MKFQNYKPWITATCAGVIFLTAVPARAVLDQDTRTLIRTSEYGLVAGTAAGLLMWPLSGQLRSVFIGSSIGLYVGIVVGVYHIFERPNPDSSSDSAWNPFVPEREIAPDQVGCLGHSENLLQDAVQARMAYLSVTEAGLRVPILHF